MYKNTSYEHEFAFFRKCLNYHNITYHIYESKKEFLNLDDLGLRYNIGLPIQSMENIKKLFEENIKEKTICYFTDEFSCHYISLLLPETSPAQLFVIGPYITADEQNHILAFISQESSLSPWINTLKDYYFKICNLPTEDPLIVLVNTFADALWGDGLYQTHYYMHGLAQDTVFSDSQKRMDIFSNIELIERIYASENELANAISHGQAVRARTIFSNLPLNGFRYDTEPVRNLKNFSIISNTLFRKAAEQGGVHPIYVEQMSSSFMQRIENLTRSDNIFELWADMIQKYCTLVNTHNTRNYSLPIQRVITRINFDITADLSLDATAEFLKINPSYLSTLFKKETGYTLTNYVNKKRMEHAAFLLSNTTLSISSIASQCGILDDNYFTKLFKRQYEMTPTRFRDSICSDISI